MLRTNVPPAVAKALLLLSISFIATVVAVAQDTEKVLYSFVGPGDGGQPFSLIFDAAGNLYGTTANGGDMSGAICSPYPSTPLGCGVVFKLTPTANGQWSESVLYAFTGGSDGAFPFPALKFDAAGNLYGTAGGGGAAPACGGSGCGVVFKLTPTSSGPWTETVLYNFTGGSDGENPVGVNFDAAGNLVGAAYDGGAGYGLVFKLTPTPSGPWTESVLYTFTNPANGMNPSTGVIFDDAGNLYGAAGGGSSSNGVIFKLTPTTSGPWSESVLYAFSGGSDGASPTPGLAFDSAGNLYGTTEYGGNETDTNCYSRGCGVVFKLTPATNAPWTESVIYTFASTGIGGFNYPAGINPPAGVIFDGNGDLFGVAELGTSGVVFKLTPNADGSWTESTPYAFNYGFEGSSPTYLILGSDGNLYGTTSNGGFAAETCGNWGCGVVFELTPSANHASTTTIVSSQNPSLPGQPITFTASVTSKGSPPPTGMAGFYFGLGCPAQGLSSSGTTSCTVSNLFENQVTAVYLGDSNYAGSTATLLQLVQSQLQLSATPSTISIAGGQQGQVALSLSAAGTPFTFSTPVTFACSGSPVAAYCSFSPSSVTTFPASVTLTINPPGFEARLRRPGRPLFGFLAILLPGLLLLPSKRRTWCILPAAAVILTVVVLSLAGCGSSQTYAVTVTASATGATSGTALVSVTVTK